MSELNELLKEINASLESTSDSLGKLDSLYKDETEPIAEKLGSFIKFNKNEKVSLLSLKNETMLSYLNSLLLIIGKKLIPSDDDGTEALDQFRDKSIENRVVLERGIKPLEKKLSYQLDKLHRAYLKAEKEYNDAEKRALERSTISAAADGSNDESEGEGEEESSSEDEELSYRPNASGITKTATTKANETTVEVEDGQEDNGGIYKPPRINAALPPQQQSHFEDKFIVKDHKNRSNISRMQAMDEYLKEESDQPEWATSIGANIVNHGKGGIKSLRATEKERDVTRYEEDNFTRMNNMGTSKVEKRKQKQRERMAKVNIIGGEDFSIFNSKRKMEDSTSRRGTKKTRSAWDRAKRRL
ncbi:hypothetical protein NCAS_0B04560 [Naumovozyma castellii]|uniref:Uncharacterized protein n=1 Tax=Naumovozyma castellii TaxID=27288 RepID=G0VAL4_NAUCA|nr:hypothetical protein NCAS_0B04560 [Naumovozyma castellii CBS 4309]CCC68540.1 hypothetical protein NCAS_0B04560 [Naumovozyma castellii CBS 4309]